MIENRVPEGYHPIRLPIENPPSAGRRGPGAGRILLDNMDPAELRRAVEVVGGRAELEASGGVTLENVRTVAESGVGWISVGALTHSAPALDVSLMLRGL